MSDWKCGEPSASAETRSEQGEHIESLVNKGLSFYEACRRSLQGGTYASFREADEQLADLRRLLLLLGTLGVSRRTEEGEMMEDSESMACLRALYHGDSASRYRRLPFVKWGAEERPSARRDWRFWVFNMLLARGASRQEARAWVQQLDGMKIK